MYRSSLPEEMNVVEKELPLREVLEGQNGDNASPLKVAKSSAVANGNGKVSRAPALREPRPLSVMEVRKFISDRSQALQAFIAPLEEEIRKAGKYRVRARRTNPASVSKVAELVLSVVRQVTHKETGLFSLDPNVPLLLSTLYAGSVEASIVSGLVRRAQSALTAIAMDERDALSSGRKSEGRGSWEYDIGRELDELTMLLKWYVRRKISLSGIEIDTLTQGLSHDGPAHFDQEEHDALFGFEVLHDHQVFGAKGCFVTSGLRLVGHDGQPLWLRVSVRWNGAPVAVRQEWASWTDPGGSGAFEVVPENSPFCSLVPIRPNAQRLVIDDIRAFVPYAALDLPSGRCDVELVVSVVDNDGREIVSASRPESICIPRRELIGFHVPAPHSVGMWPHDVVSGDKISDLSVTTGYKVVAGWERRTISVQFDLSLFMHAGESVLLECRFINEKGEIVELSSLGIPYVASELNVPVESVSSYRYRRILHPKGAWSHYRGLCIDIPVEFLLLNPGSHTMTCEVVIVSSDERILCGDMGVVSLNVSGEGTTARSENSDKDKDSGIAKTIELESIEVDPAWSFGGEEGVRVQATFCPANSSKQIADLAAGRLGELFSPYRVEISIEREDGHLLLQAFSDVLGMSFKPVTRGVCIEGHSGFTEHSIVANFKREELLGWYFGPEVQRANAKIRLFVRVRALGLNGDVILSESKEFFVRPLGSAGRQVVEVGAVAPKIVDIVAHTYVQTPRLSCRALINIPHGRYLEEGVTVVASLVQGEGAPLKIFKHRLVSQQTAAWVRQQMGLSQVPVEFEYTLPDSKTEDLKVEFSLISSYNETIHSVRQDVRAVGILADAQGNGGGSSVEQVISVLSASDLLSVNEQDLRQRPAAKGLLSWFRR